MLKLLGKIKVRFLRFILRQKNSAFFSRIKEKYYWSYERQSVSRAISLGMLMSWLPIPFQMLGAFYFAYLFKANLLISVSTVWWSNPLTWPLMLYLAYFVGTMALSPWDVSNSQALQNIDLNADLMEVVNQVFNAGGDLLTIMLVGGIICGIILSIVCYFATYAIWGFVAKNK